MADFKIIIPAACPKDWDDMCAANGGRHCCHCDKVVVDFTAMSSDEIKNYFLRKKEERICGHFKAEQVSNSDSNNGYLHKLLDHWHQYIEQKISLRFIKTATLFLLGICMVITGCHKPKRSSNPRLMGKVAYPISPENMINGEPYFPPQDTLKKDK